MNMGRMNMLHIVRRHPAQPWTDGDNIPWSEPGFSQRMLKEHLSQEHDAASRRFETIDRHVQFIHARALGSDPARVLDLGCGPGLYAQRLARLGHSVRGIDYSPASIEYARQQAAAEGLDCTYTHSDLREADFDEGGPYDLVMLIFGEFTVFNPDHARLLLRKARHTLMPGGRLLLEPSREDGVRRIGHEDASWYASESGLFLDRPHMGLRESFWDEQTKTATTRYYIVDAETCEVTRYAASYQAYSQAELRGLLETCGFGSVEFYPSLTGEEDERGDFWAVLAVAK